MCVSNVCYKCAVLYYLISTRVVPHMMVLLSAYLRLYIAVFSINYCV